VGTAALGCPRAQPAAELRFCFESAAILFRKAAASSRAVSDFGWSLILGGAALQRCDRGSRINSALAAEAHMGVQGLQIAQSPDHQIAQFFSSLALSSSLSRSSPASQFPPPSSALPAKEHSHSIYPRTLSVPLPALPVCQYRPSAPPAAPH
jgi:hypothetical protein